ncbi:hypothetical protein CLV46_0167 [Diaminobutyricimonas aerilata]|uniref:Uncharacterized protein n=1 Tax=Diaminobutyricimonas aerilata TaxID=1162967 RepID=A0A2M9CFM3_9MICO|nr:hypothetical protein [Diaminobutyricimonas aerilata]PJJ70645.1 hypothetical protein CLV46_0167 [Diaminobutyricimonas aerilata]
MNTDAGADALYEAAESAWDVSEPRPEPWAHGPWRLERRGDELADIRFDGTLVLRMIRAVVRDRDWNTVPVEVTGVHRAAGDLRLELRFDGFGVEATGTIAVSASDDGIEVRLALAAVRAFERNRMGLVVLHPPTVAGAGLEVRSPGGAPTRTRFPERIAPHQPAFDIAALTWTADGVTSALEFEGDVFEMEDQRNWTDASFKTYSTPLARPFPVHVRAGERIEQSVALRSRRTMPAAPTAPETRLALRAAGRWIPELAIGASTAAGDVPSSVRGLPVSTVLVELALGTGNWEAALDRALEEACGRPLDVRLVAAAGSEIDAAFAVLARGDVPLRRLGVFSATTHVTEQALWDALRRGVARTGLTVDLVGGARSHYTELNRRRHDLPSDLPALAFSVTPQMHATERSQLVESIGMQRLVVEDAVAMAAGRPVHVGPVTLRPRFNAVATSAGPASDVTTVATGYGAEHVPGATDPRQGAEALAAWTVASAAALAVQGVESMTFYESWGPRGVVDAAGEPYPVVRAIDWLAELAGRPMLETTGTRSPHVWILAGRAEGGDIALVANLSERPERARIADVAVDLAPWTAERVELTDRRRDAEALISS